jgi:hypothetical protein
MPSFMAGQTSTGARVASSTAASMSLLRPAATRAMKSAVAGTTQTTSASRARRMWSQGVALGEDVANDRAAGEGLERDGADKGARRPGQDHVHLGARRARSRASWMDL